jgi:hypothetical protein
LDLSNVKHLDSRCSDSFNKLAKGLKHHRSDGFASGIQGQQSM